MSFGQDIPSFGQNIISFAKTLHELADDVMSFGQNMTSFGNNITSFAKPSNQLYDDDDVTWFGKDIIWHSVKTSKSSHHSTKLCDLLAKRSCNGKYDLIGLYYYQTLVHYKKKKVVS